MLKFSARFSLKQEVRPDEGQKDCTCAARITRLLSPRPTTASVSRSPPPPSPLISSFHRFKENKKNCGFSVTTRGQNMVLYGAIEAPALARGGSTGRRRNIGTGEVSGGQAEACAKSGLSCGSWACSCLCTPSGTPMSSHHIHAAAPMAEACAKCHLCFLSLQSTRVLSYLQAPAPMAMRAQRV